MNSNGKGCVVCFTGLSGAGKTTLATGLQKRLADGGHRVELLDGDSVRKSLSKDLGFDRPHREENIRRISFVANLLAAHGVIVLISVIVPYRSLQQELRARSDRFFEIFVNAPISVCEERDPKGLYKRARAGELKNFTGIDDPYEPPEAPEIECRTDHLTIRECEEQIYNRLAEFLGEPVDLRS